MTTTAQHDIDWERCTNDGCRGVRLTTGQTCWAHTQGTPLNAALQRLGQDGRLDARGVPITVGLLRRILAAVPHDHQGNLVLTAVDFHQAAFDGEANFDRVTFQGEARFDQATFQREARFDRATFQGDAWFDGATFQEQVGFRGANFQGVAGFRGATFQERAEFGAAAFNRVGFDRASFQGEAWFAGAIFRNRAGVGRASFAGATFQERADFRRASFQGVAGFAGATFRQRVGFGEVTFQDRATFRRATFQSEAWFGRATFQAVARFDRATFHGQARFDAVTFQGVASFAGASFQGVAWFAGASFRQRVGFSEATFVGEVQFYQATFAGEAQFDQVTCKSPAHLDRTTFQGEVSYNGATFHNLATFNGAVFEQARQFGPVFVAWRLDLNDVVFHTWVQLEVAAASMRMSRTQFAGGAHIRVRWACIALDDASLAVPSVLSGVPPFKGVDERPFQPRWAGGPLGRGPAERWRPRLLTLVRTDLAGLRIADVDLRACRFSSAHNLDKLRIEGTPHLALPPPGWHLHRVGGEGLPIWRWAARLTLAEEQQWRTLRPLPLTPSRRRHPQLRGWYPPACRAAPELPEGPPRSPVQLAALYRELRKGREDAKDEPGAADFYYGEMEMRRHDPTRALGERFVLWLYWLTSGYGLRGLRALACLAVIVVALAGLFYAVGFQPSHPPTPRSFWSSLLYAAESSVWLGNDKVELTGWGRALRIVLRLAGPILLGLALLSVRNRVKR